MRDVSGKKSGAYSSEAALQKVNIFQTSPNLQWWIIILWSVVVWLGLQVLISNTKWLSHLWDQKDLNRRCIVFFCWFLQKKHTFHLQSDLIHKGIYKRILVKVSTFSKSRRSATNSGAQNRMYAPLKKSWSILYNFKLLYLNILDFLSSFCLYTNCPFLVMNL